MSEAQDQANPLHIVSIATLFPDATRPNFGIFVERSLAALARQPGIALTVIVPLGIPPWPLSLHRRYAALRRLPHRENWHGLEVVRPRFTLLPKVGSRLNATAIARALLPVVRRMQQEGRVDVLDAQFFHPDGPATHQLASALGVPFSIKARGADISLWTQRPDTGPAILAAAQAATGLLAVGEALKKDMVTAGMQAEKIRVHYTGVDATRFHLKDRATARREWNVPESAKLLLTVGALIPRKGQWLVLEAMRDLPYDVQYFMAGAGEDSARLKAMASTLGLSERVRQLGPVPNDQLPSLYAAADLMVLPSASEGLANAWVEAQACGVPLVLSDISPAHEMIDSPDAGSIAAADPFALAKAIIEVLSRPIDRQALSTRTHGRFNWDRNGSELADHLRRLNRARA
ncbi:glycosyltransferase [Sphingomonas lacunae]|uniref:Glycosyltransferase n=1 Tax=Sphingomonas lacunae TaxID=2698828 RepID=A0A6M4AVV9_9SPHN|nr:glycosyltransferase [Sphingomonas lacunae]QJQ33214.1 glycosyltransferase [Sphingomonas lacunae]